MRVKLFVAWYDAWIGAYWDRKWKRLYFLPIPFIGIRLDFGPPTFYDEWPKTRTPPRGSGVPMKPPAASIHIYPHSTRVVGCPPSDNPPPRKR